MPVNLRRTHHPRIQRVDVMADRIEEGRHGVADIQVIDQSDDLLLEVVRPGDVRLQGPQTAVVRDIAQT